MKGGERIPDEYIDSIRASYLRQLNEKDSLFYTDVARNALKFMARKTIPITPFHFETYFIVFSYAMKNGINPTDEWVSAEAERVLSKITEENGAALKAFLSVKELSDRAFSELTKDMNEIMNTMDNYQSSIKKTKSSIEENLVDSVGVAPIMELEKTLSEILAYGGEVRDKVSKTLSKLEELKNQFEELHNKALIDPLTGIYNRGAIINILENVISRKEKACVAMGDLNNFKKINDTYGHSTGDLVLKTYGEKFKELSEKYNFRVGRYGGDEFLFVILDKDIDEGFKIIRIVKNAGEDAVNKLLKEKQIKLGSSISFGITALRPTDTVNSAISRADYLLYRAKSSEGEKIATEDFLT